MITENLILLDGAGNQVATIAVTDEAEGYFTGELLSQQFSPQLKAVLGQYDEVVENQILSLLDEALAAVADFGLKVQYPNGSLRQVYSLHVNRQNEVTFRLTPVPPPIWLSRSASA